MLTYKWFKLPRNLWLLLRGIWAATWQNQQNKGAPSEDSDQPGHPPSLFRVFAVRMQKICVLSYPISAQRSLWLDWADAQPDLNLRWAHTHFVGFDMSWLISSWAFPSSLFFFFFFFNPVQHCNHLARGRERERELVSMFLVTVNLFFFLWQWIVIVWLWHSLDFSFDLLYRQGTYIQKGFCHFISYCPFDQKIKLVAWEDWLTTYLYLLLSSQYSSYVPMVETFCIQCVQRRVQDYWTENMHS